MENKIVDLINELKTKLVNVELLIHELDQLYFTCNNTLIKFHSQNKELKEKLNTELGLLIDNDEMFSINSKNVEYVINNLKEKLNQDKFFYNSQIKKLIKTEEKFHKITNIKNYRIIWNGNISSLKKFYDILLEKKIIVCSFEKLRNNFVLNNHEDECVDNFKREKIKWNDNQTLFVHLFQRLCEEDFLISNFFRSHNGFVRLTKCFINKKGENFKNKTLASVSYQSESKIDTSIIDQIITAIQKD